jgi:hypothetical protein
MKADGKRRTHDAFASHDGNLDTSAVPSQYNQGRESLVKEIGELDFLSRFVKDLMMRELNVLQVRTEQIVFADRNRVQNFICDRLSAYTRPAACRL